MDLNLQNIKLSILILTHNRPELFQRALNSVIHFPNTEIIVNNDSCDIQEINQINIKYFYKQSDDLSDIYNFLIEQSTGEYLFFLEDDDFCTNNADKILNYLNEDIIYCPFIPDNNISEYFKWFKYFPNKIIDNETLHQILDTNYKYKFQLSQIIFKKTSITNLMINNKLDNDYTFFKNLKGSVQLLNKPLFVQTTDGNDNISYSKYCKDERFKDQCELHETNKTASLFL